jgi:hypothetical protein
LEEALPMAMPGMSSAGSGEQGNIKLPGSIVNIETHHN